jgi:hypothetical protein
MGFLRGFPDTSDSPPPYVRHWQTSCSERFVAPCSSLHEAAGGCRKLPEAGAELTKSRIVLRWELAFPKPRTTPCLRLLSWRFTVFWKGFRSFSPPTLRGRAPVQRQGYGTLSCIGHIGEPTRPTRRRLLDASILQYECLNLIGCANLVSLGFSSAGVPHQGTSFSRVVA